MNIKLLTLLNSLNYSTTDFTLTEYSANKLCTSLCPIFVEIRALIEYVILLVGERSIYCSLYYS